MIDSVVIDGYERKLGLTVPASNETQMPMWATSGPSLSREHVIDIITDPTWTPRVELFGDDWVKDQDGIGACAGYAAASALERARAYRGLERVLLSGDGAYAAVNGGQDRGSGLEENMVNIRDNGIPPESEVPRWEYRKSRIPAKAYEQAKRFRGFECYAVRNELELASAIAGGFVTVVAVHAGNGGLSPDGLSDWKNGVGNHSVVVDDCRYRNNVLEFQTANSWGLKWGDRGRGWLRWNSHFSTPIKYHMFYAIRSTIDDPQGNNPPTPIEVI